VSLVVPPDKTVDNGQMVHPGISAGRPFNPVLGWFVAYFPVLAL